MKYQKGITLIALVVTIIVLLILAGVTLAFVSGENGILKRATDAVEVNEKATAEEEADLLIADLVTQYYEQKYVGQNPDLGSVDDYIKLQLTEEKNTEGGFTVKYDPEKEEVIVSKDDKPISSGPLVDGKVEWAEKMKLGIKLSNESKGLKPNDTFKIEASIYPKDEMSRNILWSSENEEIATVSQNGTVTAKIDGITNIKATIQDEETVSAICKIIVSSDITEYSVLNYPVDIDGDGNYENDWNVLYEGEEGLYLIASKCIAASKYDTNKFTSHGYYGLRYSESNSKFVRPWDDVITGTNSDYLTTLDRLSEIPGNEMILDAWNKLPDSEKKKWASNTSTINSYNVCAPGMLDYNMWTDFLAPDLGDLCIGSPTIKLLQLSCEWSGKGNVEVTGGWNLGKPLIYTINGNNGNAYFGSSSGTPFESKDGPFITLYGFVGNNSGIVLSGLENCGLNFVCWIYRGGVTAGVRPCVKIKPGFHFDKESLTLKK